MRTFAGLCLLCVATPATAEPHAAPSAAVKARASFPFADWTALLDKYVDDHGRVRYAEVDRHAVDVLLAELAAVSPRHDAALHPSNAAELAYFIDGYNIAVWASVLRRPAMKSVMDDKKAIFETTLFSFGGESLTLQQVEERVRKLVIHARTWRSTAQR